MDVLVLFHAAGRRTSSTDALGNTTSYVYDAAGRMIETVFADGARAKVEYDALGRKTADVDPDNRRTEYVYDALGRLTAVKLAAGTTEETLTTYGYDELGNRISQTDAEGRTTRFTHDSAGRETSRVLPAGERESKAYDALGQLQSHTDFIGKTTSWSYDAEGRVQTIDYPNDADVHFTYTATGQRATAVDGQGTTTWNHDAQDRLVRKTNTAGRTIEYRYDAAGNLVSRVTANQTIVYGYDSLNRMTSVVATVGNEPPRTTRYTYDKVGNRATMAGADGVLTEYTYDSRYRLRNIAKHTAAGVLLFAAAYNVDATGMRTSIEETDATGIERTVAWAYDGLKRLTRETIVARDPSTSRTSAWTYDRVGNRQTQTVTIGGTTTIATAYTYDVDDRLLTETRSEGLGAPATTTYSYDANGNTIRKVEPIGATEYVYDDANRLQEFRRDGARTTYAYDVDGIRQGQTTLPVSGEPTTTSYLVDENFAYAQVVEEFEQEGDQINRLSAVLTFGDDLIAQMRYSSSRVATQRTVHADGFASTRLLTDGGAIVTDTWAYDAFGNEIQRVGATPTEHLYRSQQFDEGLELYNLRARYYSPTNGRFVTFDSWPGSSYDPASLHKYAYAASSPTSGSDPSGHMTLGEVLSTFSVKAVLTRAAVGSVIGGIDAKLKGGSFVGGAAVGAIGGVVSPLIPLRLGMLLGAVGIAHSVANGHYAAAFFESVTLGAGFLFQGQGFSSFREFKQLYGPAGPNRGWHHLVEQGPNKGIFPPEKLQHPNNIVNIPNALHDRISAFYNSRQADITGAGVGRLRHWIRTRPFDEQYSFGLWAMAKLASPHLNSVQANQVGLGISYGWETAVIAPFQESGTEDDSDE